MRIQLSTLISISISISTLLSLLSATAIPADVRAVAAQVEARKDDRFCGLSPCPGKARAVAGAIAVELDVEGRKEDGFCGGYPCPGKLI